MTPDKCPGLAGHRARTLASPCYGPEALARIVEPGYAGHVSKVVVHGPDGRCSAADANRKNGRVALQRMDNVGIVVESLDAAVSFFAELGLELEGRFMIEGDWSGRVMFAVDDLDETLARLQKHGVQVVDEVVQYEDVYRLCYVRGPEGILIGLAEHVG